MATFTWNGLTVSVGEMSRAAALTCARQFGDAATIFTDFDDLMYEGNLLVVLHAPVLVKFEGALLDKGQRELHFEDETLTLVLPPTRESFNALPMSLTQAWIDAAVRANGWFVDTLKKALSLASPTNSEPKSGDGLSNEPSATIPVTMTPGE